MKILSLGSLNLDYVYKVEHFVQAGETIASLGRNEFCGGKGLNQSIALARAGAQVYHAGKIGADGDKLKRKLEDNGVNTDFVLVDESLPTGHAVIQVDAKGQNCIIIYGGANRAIQTADIDGILSAFAPGDIMLVQNEISNLGYAIEKAHAAGLQVALNPSPIDAALVSSQALRYVDWFILNEIEGYELTGERQPQAIGDALHKRFTACRVVLTLGKQGVLYSDGRRTARHGIYDVPVIDTTAAGDTFTGYFLASMTEEISIERALELASKASSLAVSRAGAADSIPSRRQVETARIQLDAR